MNTQRFIFLFLLSAFCGFTAHAQVRVGLRGGLISSTAHFSELQAGTTISNQTGLTGGIITEIRFNEGFAIQPEIMFAQRGWKGSSTVTFPFLSTVEVKQSDLISTIDIPLMLKGGFKAGPLRLDILAGPCYTYAIEGERKTDTKTTILITNQTSTDSKTEAINFDTDLKRSEINAQIGASLSLNLLKSRFFLDGRYQYGLSDVTHSEDNEVTTRGVIVTAGILFGIK